MLWYLPPWRVVLLEIASIASFYVVLVYDRILWRWGQSGDQWDPCMCTSKCDLDSLMVRLGSWQTYRKIGGGYKCKLSFTFFSLHWHQINVNYWLQEPDSLWIYGYDLEPTLSFSISRNIGRLILWSLRRKTSGNIQRVFLAYFGIGDYHSVICSLDGNIWRYGGGNTKKNTIPVFWSRRAYFLARLENPVWDINEGETSYNIRFNDLYPFELLVQYLELEPFQSYKNWRDAYWMELHHVEWYWETQVELVLDWRRRNFQFISCSCS